MLRLRRTVGLSTLLLITVAPTVSITQAADPQTAYPAPQAPTAEECEAKPNTAGCAQLSTAAGSVSGQEGALPNTIKPSVIRDAATFPPTVQTSPTVQRVKRSEPPTEFQRMVADSVGHMLSIYGRGLFRNSPSTFAPVTNAPVPATYVIGPGDQLNVDIWGQINVELHVFVDRDGAIYIPKVGSITVAGIHYGDLNGFLRQQIARIYRNFNLTVTLGVLRSIDVYVTGNARAPGRYTISSLSTLVNAVFATGGPSSAGSMRHIELMRGGKLVADFDLYDLLLKGDKSKDIPLLPEDVIYIPPVGPQIAVSGSVNVPAIYELSTGHASLASAIALAGGLNEVADGTRVTVERIDQHQARSVTQYSLHEAADEQVKGGDIIHVLSIVPRFENAVMLRGNVANPGRYPWHVGMRIRDLIPNKEMLLTRGYWRAQNKLVNGTSTEYGADASGSRTDVKPIAPAINWDYAVIQRIDPVDLSMRLIPFSLRKAVLERDPESNLPLESGDVVIVFSQDDLQVPQTDRAMFVRVEGEVKAPGIYRVKNGQTLRGLLRMAGGLTSSAYLYGAQFTRASARVAQQSALERTADEMEQQVQERSIANARSNPDQAAALTAQSQAQEALVRQLRTTKATGRVVLALKPSADTVSALPPILLEDGDSLYIPPKSQVVSVVGSVFDQSSFVYRKGETVNDYLRQAGTGTGDADMKHILLVRANGSVLSGSVSEYGWWRKNIKSLQVLPGDTIVIPAKLQVGGTGKAIRDWALVASQAAISAAVIAVH
jgi:polysaccharide export outer membrane protein